MAAKRGRPAKAGERYGCGKLKPGETSKQPISPVLWQRIKTNGQKIGLDPRLGTELGRLALHDELTSAEVSAGFRIAEIYHAFETFHGRTRSAAGSSFFRQFVADLEKPIETGRRRTDDYLDIDREMREREAREDFDVLQYYMPAAQRDLVEQVCVASCPINPVSMPVLKMVLQYFFEIFRDDKNYRSKRSKKFNADAPKVKFYRPKKAKAEAADKPVELTEPAPKRTDPRKAFYVQTLRILRPDLDDEQLEQAWGVYHALIARADFRKQKEAARA
ncbi:hypothetical protein BRAS3843_1480024 [Bradyrhizobium sp. STM 3843]|uniref:hypothetical protein n=1 Tax=Bradyrhizobium sp. STM 3843 TaxID=551947 RepID=UPI0002406BA3|nr:hypothetical protein [Bradyrhizobium sp. STM 3843]CCE05793.1 hypothetical protein BRAS3843_1480024 [Bradyrhizobium sp. STM 3843]